MEYRGELILIRSSRRELLDDLAAIGQFDDRRAGQKHTSADAVKKAEDILRRAA